MKQTALVTKHGRGGERISRAFWKLWFSAVIYMMVETGEAYHDDVDMHILI